MGILNVTLNTINNTTPGVQDGYRDYSCTLGTTLTLGQEYPISIRTNDNADENVRVWLDLNNDGTLNPTSELLFSSNAGRLHTGLITIPASAVRNTPLRLRVAADYVNAPFPGPCTTPQYSQTEDYAVTVVANTQAPAADFTADQPQTCSGRVQFTDQTQNAPTSWLWNFGDNTTSTQRNPLHQYAAAGTYTVTLTATNPIGSNTRTRVGYVTYDSQVPVAATCTPATTAYCCGYGITQFRLGTLVSTSADGAAGYEDFTCTRRLTTPAGSRLPWAVRTSDTNGQDVRAYLDLNDDGQFTAAELLFSAANSRNPAGEVLLPASATLNRPLRLRVLADAVGTGSGPCSNMSLGQAEDYTLTITPSTAAPSVQASNSYVVGCDTLVRFSDQTAFFPTSWLWTFGDGATSTQQHPEHRYAQPGTYRVQLRACNAFGCDTLAAAQVLRIYGRAVRPASCTLTIADRTARPWYSIREFQLHTIAHVTGDGTQGYGDFTCTQRAFLAAGGRYPVLVRSPAPITNFRSRVWIDWNNDGVLTEPQELAFSGDDDAPQHRGFIQVPAGAVPNVPLRVRVLGAYDGPALVPCGTLLYGQVEEYAVIVQPTTTPIEPWFTVSQDSACAGSTVAFQLTNQALPGGSTVAWSFGDGSTATQTAPTHAYAQAGTYTVRVTLCTGAGCRSLSRPVQVTAAFPTKPNSCASLVAEEGWGLRYGIDSVRLHTLRFINRDFERHYRDLSCSRNVVLPVGQAYTLQVAGRTAEQRAVRVYLDANNDGTFSTGELWTSGIVSPTVFSRTLPLPPGAVLNVPLRLRILTDSNFLGAGPCTVTRGQYLDFSVTITNGPLGTVRPKDSGDIYVAPNPADDTFLLHYAVPQGKTMLLTVTNSTGQTILVRRLRSTAGQQLQLSAKELSLHSGLYLLRLEVEGNVQTCKLLVAP